MRVDADVSYILAIILDAKKNEWELRVTSIQNCLRENWFYIDALYITIIKLCLCERIYPVYVHAVLDLLSHTFTTIFVRFLIHF